VLAGCDGVGVVDCVGICDCNIEHCRRGRRMCSQVCGAEAAGDVGLRVMRVVEIELL